MSTPLKIMQLGNQLSIIMDDNTRVLCYPSSSGLWTCTPSGGPSPTPTGDIAWPFSKSLITSGYGPRTGGVGTFHEGVDFAGGKAVMGADILACADGTVKMSETNSGFGNFVAIFHRTMSGFDFWSVYGHMDSREVVAGMKIKRGTKVGTLGATGFITGACLHWETHKCAIGGSPLWNTLDNGNPRTAVDPVQFMTDFGSEDVLNA